MAEQNQPDGQCGEADEEQQMPGELARRSRVRVGGHPAAVSCHVVEVELPAQR